MAKKAKISPRTKRALRRRVSTRKLASPPRADQKRTAPELAEAAETLKVTFGLHDVSGQPINDPETFFTFRRLSNNRQLADQLQVPVTGSPIAFDVPVAVNQVLVCEIDPKRFRFVHSPVFFGTPGPPVRRNVQLFREPEEWQPQFTRWNDLPTRFDLLKVVLGDSAGITHFKETNPIADRLVGEAYDRLSGEKLTLAKTTLLNTYYRLSGPEPISNTNSWFSFVRTIVAIGRERVLAFADPALDELVGQIHSNIGEFKTEYERTPAENHRGNVPEAFQSRIAHMASIKSTHAKGNFQLTVTKLSGIDYVFLDADIDENGELLTHFLDLFKHKITGGTHPHDIHELLVLQDGRRPGFDLGYTLV